MLSKSDFKIFLDSPLHLWAKKHNMYDDEKTGFDEHLIKSGYEVEEYAKMYISMHVSQDYEYQREFTHQELYTRTDFTVLNTETKKIDIYEIKASTEIKLDYHYDVAYQYYVISKVANIGKIYLVFLDKEYIREDELDLNELFRIVDMTEIALELQSEVKEKITEAVDVTKQEKSDNLRGCLRPKTCPCRELCFHQLPTNSIYQLANVSEKKILELRDLNIVDIKDIPDNFALGNRQKLQVQSLKMDKPIIQMDKIKLELDKLTYPLFFLDYETYGWAIPRYKGYKVFQNAVFQYSLHILENDHSELVHHEYISTDKEDISLKLVNKLVNEISDKGSILVWNKQFEKGRNRELAKMYPKYSEDILAMNQRMYDLGDIFSKYYYVDYRFKGSWSIKNVLPVLCPELRYSDLDISNGTTAMITWERIFTMDLPEEEKNERLKQLLEYCKMDTYAMYMIYKKIKDLF